MHSRTIRYVTIKKLAELTGYSVSAIQTKLRDEVWQEGVVYRRSPDGRIHINIQEYEKWVESARRA